MVPTDVDRKVSVLMFPEMRFSNPAESLGYTRIMVVPWMICYGLTSLIDNFKPKFDHSRSGSIVAGDGTI